MITAVGGIPTRTHCGQSGRRQRATSSRHPVACLPTVMMQIDCTSSPGLTSSRTTLTNGAARISDEEIPAIIATADAHSTGRTALASHLLRTTAVAARNAAQEIFCKIMRSDLTEPERDGWYSLAAIAPDGRPPLYYDNGALITLTISAESAYIGFDISDPRVVSRSADVELGRHLPAMRLCQPG